MTTFKAKDLDLQKLGINNDLVISRNLSYQDLVSDIIKRHLLELTPRGMMVQLIAEVDDPFQMKNNKCFRVHAMNFIVKVFHI